MNKFVIVNLVWVVVAIGAFFIGGSNEQSSTETADKNSESDKRVISSRRGGAGGSGDPSGGGGANGGKSGGFSSGVSISQFQNENDALLANKMFADLLLELSPENAREMFEALQEKGRNGNDVGQQMGLLLEAWGKVDGAAAVAAVNDLEGDGRRRGFASISAMKGWASTNPDAAKAHLEGMENGFEKGMMMQGLISGMASTDPDAATAYVLKADAERGEDGDDRWRGFAMDRQTEAIARAQMQRGMSEAKSWAEGLPEGSIKSSAFDRVAENYARSNPEEAAEWIKTHADQEYAGRAVREVAEELARKDPAAAVSWSEDLPEASQESAMRTSMERWTREDPTAAGEYLTSMGESPVRDTAVSSFAQAYDRENPALAAEWAGSIANEEMRNDTMQSVARSWLRSNADEAKAWLPNSGLSEEAQQKVIEDASRGGGRGDWGRRGR